MKIIRNHRGEKQEDFFRALNLYIGARSEVEYDPDVVSVNPYGTVPKTQNVTIKIPNVKPMKTKATTVDSGYVPRYVFNKSEFYKRYFAYPDMVHWTVRTIKDIEEIRSFAPDDADKIKANVNFNRIIDLLFSDAHHWYDSIHSSGFSYRVRKVINHFLNKQLEVEIRHIRNIREHWKENRLYFYGKELKPSKNNKSARWYLKNYPNCDPWSIAYKLDEKEPYIAGALQVSRLEKDISRITYVIDKVAKERTLFDTIKAKY